VISLILGFDFFPTCYVRFWDELLYSIDEQGCTQFIGAGACGFPNQDNEPWFPSGDTISKKLSEKYEYPLDASDMLNRVSQYVAIQNGDVVPKNVYCKMA
jgi:hypothetical protein